MVFQAGPLGVGEVGSVDPSHARERTKPSPTLNSAKHALKVRLREIDFYLVHTVCSFRLTRETIRLSWPRFMVRLLPDPMSVNLSPMTCSPKRYTKKR
jgi:hypothetical protein